MFPTFRTLTIAILTLLAITACGDEEILPLPVPPADAAPVDVDGRRMTNGLVISSRFTCDGRNLSPEISWSGVPADAQAMALVLDDPDAPGGTFIHWLIYNIPPETTSYGEGEGTPFAHIASGGSQGFNSFGGLGYSGPCPPLGEPHHYQTHVYALSEELPVEPSAERNEVFLAMDGLIIGYGLFETTYVRQDFGEKNVVFDVTPTP